MLEACLPADLRGPSTTITRVGSGLSGAGVYRVEADGQTYALKISEGTALDRWRSTLDIQQRAAAIGLAPAIMHVDEARRAVVTRFIADRSFPALWGNPATRDTALVMLGQTLRRLHDLTAPPEVPASDPRAMLAALWATLAGFAVPAFVTVAVDRALAAEPPSTDRPNVLGHNDVNPTNLVYDGERLLLFDWETAAPNEPFYDLAAIAMFLRMDDETCKQLLAAHDGAPIGSLPPRFIHDRKFIAVLCGAAFLHLARNNGHRGQTDETLDSTLSLADFYQRLRTGQIALSSADGQWSFGLALVKASVEL